MSGKNESKTIPYDCIVIGAGPSGLMAAITAARAGADVLVLEHRDKPLKKLYATGNGRCNFTNMHMNENVYRGSDSSFAYEALKVFGRDELLDFMHGLGLMTRDIDDYVYPHNEQARAVAYACDKRNWVLYEAQGCSSGNFIIDLDNWKTTAEIDGIKE